MAYDDISVEPLLNDVHNVNEHTLGIKHFLLEVSRGNIPGMSFIHKFGQNPDIDSGAGYEDIWDQGGTYTFLTSAAIMYISSSSDADKQSYTVIGLDADWNIQEVTVTANGQTQTQVGTGETFLRVYRVINHGATDNAGDVYIAETDDLTLGVPDTASKIKAKIQVGNNQTLMAIYTVPLGKTGYLMQGFSALANKTAASGIGKFMVRPFGEVFQVKESYCLHSTGNSAFIYPFQMPLKINAKSDMKVKSSSSANDVAVSAAYDILLIDD